MTQPQQHQRYQKQDRVWLQFEVLDVEHRDGTEVYRLAALRQTKPKHGRPYHPELSNVRPQFIVCGDVLPPIEDAE